MAELDYESLKNEYDSFQKPIAILEVNGKVLTVSGEGLSISDIRVENTCGFQANVASFIVYGAFQDFSGTYDVSKIDKYFKLGFGVSISLGYESTLCEVFRGYISRINYIIPRENRRNAIPGVGITCYDIKGLMMSGCYSKQILDANSYSDALRKVLDAYGYNYLQNLATKALTDMDISDTPDAQAVTPDSGENVSAFSAEMVNETDYEFAVKIAKKYNYEFFTDVGTLIFRPARSDEDILIAIAPGDGLLSLDVSYDMSGMAKEFEVRSIDPDTGKMLSSSLKNNNKWSAGSSEMKALLSKTQKIYLDSTVTSKEEAGYRAQYLMQENAYRYGSLRSEMVGLPDMIPGRFIYVGGIGAQGTYRKFYVESVVHNLNGSSSYTTTIEGRACESDIVEEGADLSGLFG